jgi:hypothetical protein
MSVTAELNAVCLNAFDDFLMQLFKKCKKCVAVKEITLKKYRTVFLIFNVYVF